MKTVGDNRILAKRRGLEAFITALHQSLTGSRQIAATDMQIKIGEYQFRYICAIEPERNPDGATKQYIPQSRYKNKKKLSLNKYGEGPFCKFRIPNNCTESGVYAITVENKVRYIGECFNLALRYNMGYGIISPRNCFKGGQETNCRVNNLLYAAAQAGHNIALWFLQTEDYKTVETKLRASIAPAWNRI